MGMKTVVEIWDDGGTRRMIRWRWELQINDAIYAK